MCLNLVFRFLNIGFSWHFFFCVCKVSNTATRPPLLRVDLNPRISKICASWMTVWNISANYVFVPLKFNLNWNIWNPFLKTSPLDFSGQRLGNTSLVMFLRFHSFSQVVKWPEFVRVYTTNSMHTCNNKVTTWQRLDLSAGGVASSIPTGASNYRVGFTLQCPFY